MDSYNITNARANLYAILNQVNKNHRPVQILGKKGNAVLISEKDWKAIEETLYLNSIPGMVDSIIEASNAPISECISADEIVW